MLIVFEVATDAAGFGDHLEGLGNAEHGVIEGLAEARIGACAGLIDSAGREDENAVGFQTVAEFGEESCLVFEWSVPDTIPSGDEIVFMREFPRADIGLVEGLLWVPGSREPEHLG